MQRRSKIPVTRPSMPEYPKWADVEIVLVQQNDLMEGLRESYDAIYQELKKLDGDILDYRYAEGKWTIKQVWQHVLDVERIFNYRALRYARKDETVLSGFDQNKYNEVSEAEGRAWKDILDDYSAVRNSTIELFNSFTDEMMMHVGTAGKSSMTVRSVGYLIIGHEMHHWNVIRERYLLK